MTQLPMQCRVPVVERPGLVLRAEEDLGITAGLQDRVVQVFGGVVYMDFAKDYMQTQGHGRCTSVPVVFVTSSHAIISMSSSCNDHVV